MSKPNQLAKVAAYTEANLEAARIIASEPDRYQGGCLEWARAVLGKVRRPVSSCAEDRQGEGRLSPGEEV